MFYNWLGLAVFIQADLSARIKSREPRDIYIFKGDLIKLRCEASETQNHDLSISWHYDSPVNPIIRNSSNTSIVTRKAGMCMLLNCYLMS